MQNKYFWLLEIEHDFDHWSVSFLSIVWLHLLNKKKYRKTFFHLSCFAGDVSNVKCYFQPFAFTPYHITHIKFNSVDLCHSTRCHHINWYHFIEQDFRRVNIFYISTNIAMLHLNTFSKFCNIDLSDGCNDSLRFSLKRGAGLPLPDLSLSSGYFFHSRIEIDSTGQYIHCLY